jgi:uncharacterized protein (DUF1015 family)
MSILLPFRALRPAPDVASRVASVPYDVVNTDEARALALKEPLSFLHVTRSEVDLPAGTPAYDPAVYERAAGNLADLRRQAPLMLDDEPGLYVYRLQMGAHAQLGVAGLFSVDEYEQGAIKKHEKTRKDKEDDRTRHIVEVGAQTGVVFLTYRRRDAIDSLVAGISTGPALYDFTAADGVRHEVWRVTGERARTLAGEFTALPALYIADGHHRAASAARARHEPALAGHDAAQQFIAVAFPDSQVQILAYNRIVHDLGGHSAGSFLDALRTSGLLAGAGSPVPGRAGLVSVYVSGSWHAIDLPAPPAGAPRSQTLDVEVLHQRVLHPLLGIGDPRTDKRLDFVGGIRGTAELERLVDGGRAAAAFSLYPVGVADLLAIADEGGIMPPKSTWFEPKLRDGLLIHLV